MDVSVFFFYCFNMSVCNLYVDNSRLLSPVTPVHGLPFRKAEENFGFTSRNDNCYLAKHIRLLLSVRENLFVDAEDRT